MSWISDFMKPSALFSSGPATTPAPPAQTSFKQEKAALLVSQELEKAIADCKKKVSSISKNCRARNRRFRDPEFDLERDTDRCLHGLSANTYGPSDVRRINEIFEDPQFFIEGASSSDLVQGAIGDCWFISALATAACAPGLVEKFCVARDEKVGVYGFIFFRDTTWATIIIDDLLYSSIPKYEELSTVEKNLYHRDKDIYNRTARRGGKSLLFARSGTENETWVPLIEKAYAKLHGNYYALHGGLSHEAIEDLTGGISDMTQTRDIFDVDRFWNEELINVNQDRLFGCSFTDLQTDRLEVPIAPTVKGLIGSHDYSVLRAVEYKGKRFLVIRNPWGKSEWTGPWSDGSKEWTKESLEALSVLGHEFGDDGQFVMEYADFLTSWQYIHRTLLFDSSWVMSSHWLRVAARPFPAVWAHGDVSFTLSIPKPSLAVIVLSRLDDRYFQDLSGSSVWSFDFILYKQGDPEEIAESPKSYFGTRSVNIEMELDAGDYVVHVRLDRSFSKTVVDRETWDKRKLALVLAERVKSRSIAANFDSKEHAKSIPIPLDLLAGRDLATLEGKVSEVAEKASQQKADPKTEADTKAETGSKAETDPKTETDPATQTTPGTDKKSTPTSQQTDKVAFDAPTTSGVKGSRDDAKTPEEPPAKGDKEKDGDDKKATTESPDDLLDTKDDDDSIYLGLRVYTNKAAPAVLAGQLRNPEKDLNLLVGLAL